MMVVSALLIIVSCLLARKNYILEMNSGLVAMYIREIQSLRSSIRQTEEANRTICRAWIGQVGESNIEMRNQIEALQTALKARPEDPVRLVGSHHVDPPPPTEDEDVMTA